MNFPAYFVMNTFIILFINKKTLFCLNSNPKT